MASFTLGGHRVLLYVGVFVGLLLLLVVVELLIVKFNGQPVPVPSIPRAVETYGSGPPLRYVVLGDSTSVGQGGNYDRGIARSTARHLGASHAVTFQNFGVSGARAGDIAGKQAPKAARLRPDVVLVTVCGNDVTHLTSVATVRRQLSETITILRQANPNVVIVLTGSPQMGSIPRFPQPMRYIAKVRTAQMNDMVLALAEAEKVEFAYVADKTGPIFTARPELFAVDKFHPNDKGYDVWTPVLTAALDKALSTPDR